MVAVSGWRFGRDRGRAESMTESMTEGRFPEIVSGMGRDGSPNRPSADGDADLVWDNGGLGEPALPKCPSPSSGLRFPFERASSCHQPPGAATSHLEMNSTRAARGAAPTSR